MPVWAFLNPGADDRIALPMLKHPPLQNATVDRHTPSALFQHFEPAKLAGSNQDNTR